MAEEFSVGIRCGNCGSDSVFMATCNNFRGTGHEWTLASLCMMCREVHWTNDGCLDCKADEGFPPYHDTYPYPSEGQ